MKWIFLLVITSLFSFPILANDTTIKKAFETQHSDIQVKGSGHVIRLLADDNIGDKHQKFIIKLRNGITLLVAHNIDLAPRVASLKMGDKIEFYGEYEWNKRGGVIHWTHTDPAGHHTAGWLKHRGKTYQ